MFITRLVRKAKKGIKKLNGIPHRKKKKNESRLGIVGICAVVVAFGVIMFIKTKDVKEEASDLSKRQQQLEQQLEDEEERAGQLEERKIYVKTKKYVEEVAKVLDLCIRTSLYTDRTRIKGFPRALRLY